METATCPVCGTEFARKRSDKKTCSTKCRVTLSRQEEAPEPAVTLSSTDKQFEAAKAGYYIFEDEHEHTSKCDVCNEEFTSKLQLLRYCSLEHHQEMLRLLSTGRKRAK